MAGLSPKQAKFVEEEGVFFDAIQAVEKLAALASLARHVFLVAPCKTLTIPEEELKRRLSLYGSDTLDACLSVIVDTSAHPVRRAACALLLECFIPGWRESAPDEMLGMIVNRHDPEVQSWRAAVLDRDEHKCSKCGCETNLHAHHIVRWADAPPLRVVLDNGKTLCQECHWEAHAKA